MRLIALAGMVTVLALGSWTAMAFADESDDTLRFYLSKSDLVVLGTIVTEPIGLSGEAGVVNYVCDFKISEVCKGDAGLQGKTVWVNIGRFEADKKDIHPLVKKDAEALLFLKKTSGEAGPHWGTADFWFGVQRPMPWMARSLARLAGTAKKDEPAAPPTGKGQPEAESPKSHEGEGK